MITGGVEPAGAHRFLGLLFAAAGDGPEGADVGRHRGERFVHPQGLGAAVVVDDAHARLGDLAAEGVAQDDQLDQRKDHRREHQGSASGRTCAAPARRWRACGSWPQSRAAAAARGRSPSPARRAAGARCSGRRRRPGWCSVRSGCGCRSRRARPVPPGRWWLRGPLPVSTPEHAGAFGLDAGHVGGGRPGARPSPPGGCSNWTSITLSPGTLCFRWAGVSSATSWPWSTMAMRSHRRSASSM